MSRFREPVRDELLVLEVQDGHLGALDELVRRWQGRLLSYCRRLVGDVDGAWDVFQESWVAIVRSIARLEDPASFRSWAYRIVTNKCRDWISQRQRQRLERTAAGDVDLASAEPVSPQGDGVAEADALATALQRLSAEHRTILSLRYQEHMSFDEIAIAVGIPEGTVKSRLYHARNQLKAALDRQDRRSEHSEPK